ncbi:MAG: aldehyde dehydrogenase family protein [Saprospiraceae bacterium]|nr:aldehyde dehydrogenase family protein [Saprospiraceae bacterium]
MTTTFKIVSPVDGSLYAERPAASDRDIEQALQQATKAQRAWGETTIAERATICANCCNHSPSKGTVNDLPTLSVPSAIAPPRAGSGLTNK